MALCCTVHTQYTPHATVLLYTVERILVITRATGRYITRATGWYITHATGRAVPNNLYTSTTP